MLIIKEDNRVYLIESTYSYSSYGEQDQALISENMPIFRAYKSKILIGGDCIPDLEAIRYLRLPLPKELSAVNLVSKTVPAIKSILQELGRLDKNSAMSNIVFAKADKVLSLTPNSAIREIFKEEAIGWQDDRLRYALAITEGMPLDERIQKIYKIVGKILGVNMFPLIMMDSTSFKLKIIEEKK